ETLITDDLHLREQFGGNGESTARLCELCNDEIKSPDILNADASYARQVIEPCVALPLYALGEKLLTLEITDALGPAAIAVVDIRFAQIVPVVLRAHHRSPCVRKNGNHSQVHA